MVTRLSENSNSFAPAGISTLPPPLSPQRYHYRRSLPGSRQPDPGVG